MNQSAPKIEMFTRLQNLIIKIDDDDGMKQEIHSFTGKKTHTSAAHHNLLIVSFWFPIFNQNNTASYYYVSLVQRIRYNYHRIETSFHSLLEEIKTTHNFIIFI